MGEIEDSTVEDQGSADGREPVLGKRDSLTHLQHGRMAQRDKTHPSSLRAREIAHPPITLCEGAGPRGPGVRLGDEWDLSSIYQYPSRVMPLVQHELRTLGECGKNDWGQFSGGGTNLCDTRRANPAPPGQKSAQAARQRA